MGLFSTTRTEDRGRGLSARTVTTYHYGRMWAAGITAFALLVTGIAMLIGATWSKTDASSMTCVYNGGPIDSRDYRGYEEPGAGRNYQGLFSETVDVPVAIRQYRVSLNPEQGDTPAPDSIKVRVKGYDMTFEPTVTFTINTQLRDGKPVACDFIEKQLRQFNATDFNKEGGNWQYGFLNERFRPVLDDVTTRVLQAGFDPGAVKFNLDGERDRAADEIGRELKKALDRSLGDDYFCTSNYKFAQDTEACGNSLTVILPEPSLSDDDEAQLAKPQRAKIDADNDIAAADEQARKAAEVAEAKEKEAESAERKADAEEKIASESARVQDAQATIDYAWCEYLVSLGQDCALVKAAENKNFPTVIGGDTGIVVPLPENQG